MKIQKRWISVLLVSVMTVSLMPGNSVALSAYAEEPDNIILSDTGLIETIELGNESQESTKTDPESEVYEPEPEVFESESEAYESEPEIFESESEAYEPELEIDLQEGAVPEVEPETATPSDADTVIVADEERTELQKTTSGTIGDLTWTLADDGTLTVSGTGAMPDLSYNKYPWYNLGSSIKKVVIEADVTHIGENSFASTLAYGMLTTVDIKGNPSMGAQAFKLLSWLTTVTYNGTVTQLGYLAFSSCDNLNSFTMREGVGQSPQVFWDSFYPSMVKLTDANNKDVTSYYSLSAQKGALIIKGKLESAGSIDAIADQEYTGDAIEPAVTVTFRGKTLTKDTDYTVAYSNNTDAGSATVTVTGMGYYTGTITTGFTIEIPCSHDWKNGICTNCGGYQPATDADSDGTYEISNAGQLFWFAQQVNSGNTSAKAVLTNNIDLSGTVWTPIGTDTCKYAGTFDGQGYAISNMTITAERNYQGLFGCINGGTLKSVTVTGTIECTKSGVAEIGGAAGYASNATLTDIHSEVEIKNSEGIELHHVGGVVGNANNPATVERCIFSGTITIYSSTDCIGGVAGYANQNVQIINCANLGSVTASRENSYTGGILGYVNNANFKGVQNCYNYGTVSGTGIYTGAIVGWSRDDASHTKMLNNYYLSDSCTTAFGTGGKAGTATVMNASQFASGEVAYLLNNSVTDGTQAWYQDIDNGLPTMEVPGFSGGTVYYVESMEAYSNDPNGTPAEVVSVDISWGAMSFTYQDGAWTDSGSGWFNVENNGSNVPVKVTCIYNTDRTDISGSFTDGTNPVSEPLTLAVNDTKKIWLILSGKPSEALNNTEIGTVTVKITEGGD